MQVSDEGKGLTTEEIRKLCKVLSKVERPEDVSDDDGVGMGLIMCKKIVENNEGKIRVTSKGPGKGSTFHFTMRMLVPDDVSGTETSPSHSLMSRG